MPGLKTNEREGTRAVLRHARVSPYKVREVLDLVRGKPVHEAEDILRFSERDAAFIVGKVLHSAVANAENNDELDPEELFVSACFADEGTTIKRWRPRARGRATRIRKRTSHITVIVSRMPDEQLQRLAGPPPGRAAGPAGPPGGRRPPGRGRPALPGRAPPWRPRHRRSCRGRDDRRRGADRRRPRRRTDDEPATGAESDDSGGGRRDRRRTLEARRGRRRPPTPRTPTTAEDADGRESRRRGEPGAGDQRRDGRRARARRRPARTRQPRTRATASHGRGRERRAIDGSEGQPVRVPPGRDHRLEVAVVHRPRLPGLPHRGLEDPRLPDEPAGAGRGQPHRDRADPRPAAHRRAHGPARGS